MPVWTRHTRQSSSHTCSPFLQIEPARPGKPSSKKHAAVAQETFSFWSWITGADLVDEGSDD